jgi:Fe-S oxidoreductase
MATLKAEALHHKHETKGIPLRSRVFAGIRGLNRLGAASAPMANLPNRVPALRKLMARAIGIAPERPLPAFAAETLLTWFHSRRAQESHIQGFTGPESGVPELRSRGPLTFLGDSFTSFTEPAIGIAAIELLELAGWDVRLESGGCCGRAAFSKGMLDQAKRQASGLVDALAGTKGPIAGVEPSCVLTLGDEHRALLGADDPRVADVAGRARLVDELLVEAIDDGALRLREDAWPAGHRILYHGHCHQKAEVGTAATVALLSRIPGAEVVEVDAGCCGMAGSFGFEAEHYEVSMQVGEDRLFPAVRAEPEGTVIAATGVSCRQQIAHGTTRRAHHPVELIRAALA